MSTFSLTVVANESKTGQGPKGPYQYVEIAYKNNTYQGKLESFKVLQFSPVFKQAAEMQNGQTYSVTKEKNGQYNNWVAIVPSAPGASVQTSTASTNYGAPPANKTSGVSASARSSYETPEERAKKQIFIIKQSCLAQAVATLVTGAKTPPSTSLILQQAQEYLDWVVEDKPLSMDDLTKIPNDTDFQVE